MALLWMIGFDLLPTGTLSNAVYGDVNFVNTAGGTQAKTVAGGAFGTGKYLQTQANDALKFLFPSNVTTGFVGMRLNLITGQNNYTLGFQDSGTNQFQVIFDTLNNAIKVLDSSGATQGTSLNQISAGNWTYFEIGFVVASGTSGSVTIKKNGATILNVSGISTKSTGNAYIQQIRTFTGFNAWSFDDMYLCDNTGSSPYNTFLGNMQVQGRTTTGAGTNTQWTPSAGSNYSAANDATWTGVTYVSSNTIGQIDDYQLTALTNSPSAVLGTQNYIVAEQTAAGGRAAEAFMLSSGTSATDTSTSLNTSYTLLPLTIRTVDPHTSAAWTVTAVNNATVGPELTA